MINKKSRLSSLKRWYTKRVHRLSFIYESSGTNIKAILFNTIEQINLKCSFTIFSVSYIRFLVDKKRSVNHVEKRFFM